MTNEPDITTLFCADLQFNAWQYSWERWSPSRSQDNWNQRWECCRHLAPAHCGALSHYCGRGRFIGLFFFFPSASPCLANETALRSPNVSEFRRASDSGSPIVISGSRVVDSSVSGFILSRARNNVRIVSGHDDRPNSFLLGHVSFRAGQMYMMNYSFRGQ